MNTFQGLRATVETVQHVGGSHLRLPGQGEAEVTRPQRVPQHSPIRSATTNTDFLPAAQRLSLIVP